LNVHHGMSYRRPEKLRRAWPAWRSEKFNQ